MGANGLGAANGLPLNFFVADPWATSATYVDNAGWCSSTAWNWKSGAAIRTDLPGQITPSAKCWPITHYRIADGNAELSDPEQHRTRQIRRRHQREALFRHELLLSAPVRQGTAVPGRREPPGEYPGGRLERERLHALSSGAPLSLTSNRFTTGWGSSKRRT